MSTKAVKSDVDTSWYVFPAISLRGKIRISKLKFDWTKCKIGTISLPINLLFVVDQDLRDIALENFF